MIGKFLWIFVILVLSHEVNCDEYDDKVIFNVSSVSKSVIWSHTNTTLTSLGCDPKGKFAFVVHGWQGAGDVWITNLAMNLLKRRGGCVIDINWMEFAKNLNYHLVRETFWPQVSSLITRKLKQMEAEGILPENVYMYGHSLGARLVIDAAYNFGQNRVGMIDACDAAGPEFHMYDLKVDAKKAAKNVQCIHTSILAGTITRNCHQDFILGNCGVSQPAAQTFTMICQLSGLCKTNENSTEAEISHNLCNIFYNNAFDNDFLAQNNRCLGATDVKVLPAGYKMGYDESRTSAVRGIFPVPTYKVAPYNKA